MKPTAEDVLAGKKVLVVGSLNLDHHLRTDGEPSDDGTARVVSYSTAGGGHAGNGATALARLGCDVSIFTVVGADPDGDRLLEELADAGIRTDLAARMETATTGQVFIPAFPTRHYMLMFRGATDAWPAETCAAVPFAGFDAVLLFDPAPAVLPGVVAGARAAGVPVYWNPGGLHSPADGVLTTAAQVRRLLVNRAEFVQLFGVSPSPLSASTVCRRHRIRQLVVTLGAEGAMAVDGTSVWTVAARPAQVVSPAGAGDAFAAASTAADLVGEGIGGALQWGVAAGGHAVTTPGTRDESLTLKWLLDAVAARRERHTSFAPAPGKRKEKR